MTLRLVPFALLLASAAPAAALGQATVQPIPGTTDADRLAAQMRLLAANPTDLEALLIAGELSVKLDDLGAAAAFFARAERIDPRSGRAKAGEGAILVHAERPGEALRYFAQAAAAGLAPAAFASDRGLAYDLIGDNERAQRDYRLALKAAPDDETRRRYALSLGIVGKRALAEEQLEPLLRRSDRAAWRAHAFILAMSADQAGATRIATTMMPPGTAAGLEPFFGQLATLGPVDRAFAVHFGEIHGSPQRLADARLAPAPPALGPDPDAPRIAAVVATGTGQRGKRRDKDYGRDKAVRVAAATPAAVPVARGEARAPAAVATTPATPLASAAVPSRPPPVATPTTRPARVPAETNVIVAAAPVTPPPPAPAAPLPRPAATIAAPVPEPVVTIASPSPATVVAIAAPPVPAPASDALTAGPSTAIAGTATAIAPAPPPAGAAVPTAPPRDGLSQIVASLPIPASELGVDAPRRPAPVASPPPPVVDQAALDREARAAAAKALADKRAADRKAAADKKALAEKKAAAEKKAEEAREAAVQRKIERANPERIWVQVAGGANADGLAKAWASAKAKGGDAFAGHATGWTTPLRFTNRVLAGPFKTDADARAFINKLKAKGLSGFAFTSDAGQVVKKLDAE